MISVQQISEIFAAAIAKLTGSLEYNELVSGQATKAFALEFWISGPFYREQTTH